MPFSQFPILRGPASIEDGDLIVLPRVKADRTHLFKRAAAELRK